MDSDKENAPTSLSTSNSSLLQYRSMPEDLNCSTANSTMLQPDNRAHSTSHIIPENLDLSEPALSSHEINLARLLPEVAALVGRLKIVGNLNGISNELLEPVTNRLENQTVVYETVRGQGATAKENAQGMLVRVSEIKKQLEDELSSILDGFGLGLPTEKWHVEAIRAAVAEKLRQKSKEIQDRKQ